MSAMKSNANKSRTRKGILLYAFALSALVCLFYLAKKELLGPNSDFAGGDYYFNASFYGALAVGGSYLLRKEGVSVRQWFKDLAGVLGLLVLVIFSLPLYMMLFYAVWSPLILFANLLSGNIDYLFLLYYFLIAIFFFFLLNWRNGR
jgi:hypothetical protein